MSNAECIVPVFVFVLQQTLQPRQAGIPNTVVSEVNVYDQSLNLLQCKEFETPEMFDILTQHVLQLFYDCELLQDGFRRTKARKFLEISEEQDDSIIYEGLEFSRTCEWIPSPDLSAV